jgi:acetoin utilization protein AcuB
MLVRDVMTPNPVTVRPSDTLLTARARMEATRCRRLPVLDEQGHLCGIITDRDLRLATHSPLVLRERWEDELLLTRTEVDACMTPDPITISADEPVERAVDLLLEHTISGLPVLEGDRLVGIVTVTDLLRALRDLLRSGRP